MNHKENDMNIQPVEYKAKSFDARNLVIFVLVILGMTGVAVGLQAVDD